MIQDARLEENRFRHQGVETGLGAKHLPCRCSVCRRVEVFEGEDLCQVLPGGLNHPALLHHARYRFLQERPYGRLLSLVKSDDLGHAPKMVFHQTRRVHLPRIPRMVSGRTVGWPSTCAGVCIARLVTTSAEIDVQKTRIQSQRQGQQ